MSTPDPAIACPVSAADHAAWDLGGILVRRIAEIVLPEQTGPWLLPDATSEVLNEAPWLRPDFAGRDAPTLVTQTFAVEADGRRILVDTGIGNGKNRANPAWHDLHTDYLERLSAAGFPRELVDTVILTHLHADHVGWNTVSRGGIWVPTFPNARYITARTEWDYWAGFDMEASRRQLFQDSVHPIAEAGLLELVALPEAEYQIADGVRLILAPGHTPGQVAVELRGADRSALITGDSIHHPVQLSHPRITSRADVDPDQAVRTRHHLLDELADTEALLLGTHFPHPTAGLVRRDGARFQLHGQPGTAIPATL